jgi:nitrate reductase cytochrome c-type subunit
MLMRNFISTALLIVTYSGVAMAGDFNKCVKCHEPDEFEGMSAADISATIRDISIVEHKKLTDLSDEQVEMLAAELAGG